MLLLRAVIPLFKVPAHVLLALPSVIETITSLNELKFCTTLVVVVKVESNVNTSSATFLILDAETTNSVLIVPILLAFVLP